jgi:hypothetical protein
VAWLREWNWRIRAEAETVHFGARTKGATLCRWERMDIESCSKIHRTNHTGDARNRTQQRMNMPSSEQAEMSSRRPR